MQKVSSKFSASMFSRKCSLNCLSKFSGGIFCNEKTFSRYRKQSFTSYSWTGVEAQMWLYQSLTTPAQCSLRLVQLIASITKVDSVSWNIATWWTVFYETFTMHLWTKHWDFTTFKSSVYHKTRAVVDIHKLVGSRAIVPSTEAGLSGARQFWFSAVLYMKSMGKLTLSPWKLPHGTRSATKISCWIYRRNIQIKCSVTEGSCNVNYSMNVSMRSEWCANAADTASVMNSRYRAQYSCHAAEHDDTKRWHRSWKGYMYYASRAREVPRKCSKNSSGSKQFWWSKAHCYYSRQE